MEETQSQHSILHGHFSHYCLQQEAKYLGITRVVGFFVLSMPYQLPPPCYPHFFLDFLFCLYPINSHHGATPNFYNFSWFLIGLFFIYFLLQYFLFPEYFYWFIFKKWAIPGLFFLYFCLFITVDSKQMINKFSRWLDTNCGPLVLEANTTNWATTTALWFIYYLYNFWIFYWFIFYLLVYF